MEVWNLYSLRKYSERKKTYFVSNFSPPSILMCGRYFKINASFFIVHYFSEDNQTPRSRANDHSVNYHSRPSVLCILSYFNRPLSALSFVKNFVEFFVKAAIFRNMVGKNLKVYSV